MNAQSPLPTVDVVIPVHTSDRPIRRAVSSVISNNAAGVRAIVVCHNISLSAIAPLLNGLDPSRYTLVEHIDDIPSPAGPLNVGVTLSSADYVTVLGSDDEYEPFVFDAWRTELRERPALLVGQFKVETAGRILAPAPRIGRFSNLDSVKDQLYSRTPPLAVLIRSDQVQQADYPGFAEGIRNGEDIALSIFLWSFSPSIRYSRCSDGFWGWESGPDRVTSELVPLTQLLEPVDDLLKRQWTIRLAPAQRTAVALKLARNHVLSFFRERTQFDDLSEPDLRGLQSTLHALDGFAPGYRHRLTFQDFAISEAILRGDQTSGRKAAARSGVLYRAFPRHLRHVFAWDGMPRRLARILCVPPTLKPAAVLVADRRRRVFT